MSTITYFIDHEVANKLLGTQQGKVENVLDFSKKSVLAGDVVQAIKVPKGALITKVVCYTNTAEGATCTATVGDADGANSWDASINLNSANALAYSTEGTDAYAPGKVYLADDTIDLTMGHDTDAAKVTIVAEYSIVEAIANA